MTATSPYNATVFLRTVKNDRYKNIFFLKIDKLPKPWKNEEFKFNDQYEIFTFSEPIYYDEKYAVFTKIKTNTYSKTFSGRSIVIMEKKDGKWKVLQYVGDGVYN